MRLKARPAAIIMAAGLLVTLTGAAAEAGPIPSTHIKMRIGKHIDGPFRIRTRVNVGLGEAKNAYLKVKSISGMPEGAFLQDDYEPNGIKQKYFTKNGTEITDDVNSVEGYLFGVKADKAKLFRMRVKHTSGAGKACWTIFAQDDADGNFSVAFIDVNQRPEACV